MRRAGVVLALLVAVGVLYWPNRDHAFFLDSSHVIVENQALRDLKLLGRYFTDPATFTSLRANVDWRPLLTLSYALNYAACGLAMPGWHLVQVLLHLAVGGALWLLGRRVAADPLRAGDLRVPGAALAAVAWFLVHPANVGAVSYLSARSSMQCGLFALLALVAYARAVPRADAPGVPALAPLAFAAAMLTKVEAIGMLAGFFLWEAWRRWDEGKDFLACVREALDRRTLRRMAPLVVITVAYFAARHVVMAPFELAETRAPIGVDGRGYLATQLGIWWRYVRLWWAPVGMVADDGAYRMVTSLADPRPWLAGGAWVAVAAALVGRWRRDPAPAFLAVTALALLSPTSSFLPLAEAHNELRPYVPVGLLSLAWVEALAGAGGALPGWARRAALAGVGVWTAGLLVAATARVQDFTTSTRYWEAVLAEAPSARAHNNLGLARLAEGRDDEALGYFRRAVELAPSWYISRINLAMALDRRGQSEAEAHWAQAVALDRFTTTSRLFRAEAEVRKQRWAEAWDDLAAIAARQLRPWRFHAARVVSAAHLGHDEAARESAARLLAMDAPRAAPLVVQALGGYFLPGREEAGVRFLEALRPTLEGEWWVHYNLGSLRTRLGQAEEAAAAFQRSAALRPAATEGG